MEGKTAPLADETFGQWLTRELTRRSYDLSQRGGGRRQFADQSGVSIATLSRFLRDIGSVEPRTLRRIAEALGVPVAPLLVKADILPASELPGATREISPHEALTALGATSPTDQAAVMDMIHALRQAQARADTVRPENRS
jgi:transcriptional regulator with XRE-family HTH domain